MEKETEGLQRKHPDKKSWSLLNLLPSRPSLYFRRSFLLHIESKLPFGNDDTNSPLCDPEMWIEIDKNIKAEKEKLLKLAGFWNVHHFDKVLFDTKQYNSANVKKLDEANYNDLEKQGILTDRIIARCSSLIQRSPIVEHFAYTKVELISKKLEDISILRFYHYIQYLDLSFNNLKDLKALGQLPFLIYLDVSNNNLETILDFRPPLYLTFVNYSSNVVKKIGDLSEFWSLIHLNLSSNAITKIEGLENLKYLTFLDLSENFITKLENLNHMNLAELILHSNNIREYEIVENVDVTTLLHLTYINLNDNELKSLELFQYLEYINAIDVAGNEITSLLDLYCLSELRFLVILNLMNNPITSLEPYMTVCITCCKHLQLLDGQRLDPAQRIKIIKNVENYDRNIAVEKRIQLILLQQINFPRIGSHVLPFDQPLAMIMILVGPPCCDKEKLIKKFCQENQKYCALGVSHTTRPKRDYEKSDEDYHFVSENVFREMLRKGEFLSEYEYNEQYYGLAESELIKTLDKVLVIHMDYTSALTLVYRGFDPKMILAIPQTEADVARFMERKMCYNLRQSLCKRLRKFNSLGSTSTDTKTNNESNDIFVQSESPSELDEEKRSEEPCWSQKSCSEATLRRRLTIEEKPGILKADQVHVKKDVTGQAEKSGVSFRTCGLNNECLCNPCVGKKKPEPGTVAGKPMSRSIRSVSDMKVGRDIPYLSVLSDSSDYNLSLRFDEDLENETVFSKYEMDSIKKFEYLLQNALKSRRELLELHWANPGLFCDVIFTNNESSCLKKMKLLLKDWVKNYKYNPPIFHLKEDDPSVDTVIQTRIQEMYKDLWMK